jgi:hypothetical protein
MYHTFSPTKSFHLVNIGRYLRGLIAPKPVIPKSVKSKPYFLVPRLRVKNFFGRDEELDNVTCYFRDGVERPRILVLHALGGQGKSQIALEYCQQARQKYRGVFWINSSFKSTLTQGLVGVAREINPEATDALSDDDAKVALILRTLEEWEDRWLMVFDNCDDPATILDIEQFIPQGMLSAKITCMDTNFNRRQRRCSLHQSPSRSGGIGSYHRYPTYAGQGRRRTAPTSICRHRCEPSYIRRFYDSETPGRSSLGYRSSLGLYGVSAAPCQPIE